MANLQPESSKISKLRRKATLRRIDNDVWQKYRAEVLQLYIHRQPPLTLRALMQHFQVHYAFSPTQKQWKDRLSKWGIQRNLDVFSAAIICYLHKEAKDHGINRQVLHNHREKTRADVQRYISKTNLVSNEQALLSYLPSRHSWQPNITWIDDTEPTVVSIHYSTDQEHFAAAQPPHFAYPLPWNADSVCEPPGQAFPAVANNNLDIVNHYFNLPSNPTPGSFGLLPVGGTSDPVMKQPPWSTTDHEPPRSQARPRFARGPSNREPVLQPNSSNSDDGGSASEDEDEMQQPWEEPVLSFGAFTQPFQPLQTPHMVSTSHLNNINLAASATPPQFNSSAGETESEREAALEAFVHGILGAANDLQNEPEKLFVNYCVQAMVYYGQDMHQLCARSTDSAVNAFHTLISTSLSAFVKSVPNLNLMSFIFEVYGHRNLKRNILQRLRSVGLPEDRNKRLVISESIEFLLDTTDWNDDKIATNRQRVHSMYEAAIEIAGLASQLAVAARYNEAWLMLEDKRADEALTILITERGRCETACGIYALQTISWTLTQARAHLCVGEPESAEMLLREVVLPRSKTAFSEDHAVFWEVTGRIGLFLLKFAYKKSLPSRTQECWDTGEDLLRKTLVWRGRWLGSENPQTTNAFRLLKSYLEKQGKVKEAANLFNTYSEEVGYQ